MKCCPAWRLCGAILVLFSLTAPASAYAEIQSGTYRGTLQVVRFDVSPPLREIPPIPVEGPTPAWGGLMVDPPGFEGPPKHGPQSRDQVAQHEVPAQEIPAPIINFDSLNNISQVSPPDPVGDIGPNHYVAMSNLSFEIYNRAGASVFGPAANNTLWTNFGGPCQTQNAGDPIVLYDQFADRWLLTQFTSSPEPGTNQIYNCIAVSQTPDPTGSYYRYQIANGVYNFPDYPKYGVGEEAYFISTRDFDVTPPPPDQFAGIGVYALNRAQMIAGNPNPTVIYFSVDASIPENVGDGILPMDIDGPTLPPPGAPHYFIGTMDDGGPYLAPQDAITIWEFDPDFTTPANSTFILAETVPIAPYDTVFPCTGQQLRNCIPQPNTSNEIDHQGRRQRPLHRAAYRNFGIHESIVTNQSVEAAPGMSGIRWWEIRSPGSSPVIHQEGTYAPGVEDGVHRWFGSAAMDSAGNIALGYSASSTSVFPSIWYSGRLFTDLPGVMPQGEGVIVNGTGSQTGSQRWGDYSSMNVDPVDDCTFWYVNEYIPVTSLQGWRMRVGAFSFDECGVETFALSNYSEPELAICQGDPAEYDFNIGSVEGFNDPVTLSVFDNPGTANFSVNPVTPPDMSLLTISNTGAVAAGNYPMTVEGSDGGTTRSVEIDLEVIDAVPPTPTPMLPADTAVDVPLTPTFEWSDVGAEEYFIEIGTDPDINNVVISASVEGQAFTPFVPLDSDTTYYWSVAPSNACGFGAGTPVRSFTTLSLPGDCPADQVEVVAHAFDFESGAQGWTFTSALGSGVWALSNANPSGGMQHWHGDDPFPASDHRLSSPVLAVPAGLSNLTFRFSNYQDLEANPPSNCWDGGILEVSTNGGTSFTQVGNADLLTDPYDGTITAGPNPLSNLPAWCGQVQPYTDSRVDISDLAGENNVVFRFRIGTDNLVATPGWDIDDVEVVGCAPQPALDWGHGFEVGDGQ